MVGTYRCKAPLGKSWLPGWPVPLGFVLHCSSLTGYHAVQSGRWVLKYYKVTLVPANSFCGIIDHKTTIWNHIVMRTPSLITDNTWTAECPSCFQGGLCSVVWVPYVYQYRVWSGTVFVTDMGSFEGATERQVSVESGQVAVLDLPAIESHPAPLVTWLMDGQTQLYDRKYAMTADNQLVILDASESDQKAYRWIRMSGCSLVGLCNFGIQPELLYIV